MVVGSKPEPGAAGVVAIGFDSTDCNSFLVGYLDVIRWFKIFTADVDTCFGEDARDALEVWGRFEFDPNGGAHAVKDRGLGETQRREGDSTTKKAGEVAFDAEFDLFELVSGFFSESGEHRKGGLCVEEFLMQGLEAEEGDSLLLELSDAWGAEFAGWLIKVGHAAGNRGN